MLNLCIASYIIKLNACKQRLFKVKKKDKIEELQSVVSIEKPDILVVPIHLKRD